MTTFKTITEEQILNAAYDNILAKWAREDERRQRAMENGRPHAIADHWIAVYGEQLNELHEALIEIEKENV